MDQEDLDLQEDHIMATENHQELEVEIQKEIVTEFYSLKMDL